MDPAAFIGRTIADRYEILSVAGSGGMGTVFRARQADLDRTIALKVLDPGLIADDDAMKRFEREAKSLSLLSNVHIASFYSYGVLDGSLPYIVMEYVDGKSLSLRLQSEEELDVEKALQIAIQVSEALAYAHKAGVIHRDLKPANILLLPSPEPDFVKVVDFGLSYIRSGEYSENLTKTGMLMGTPQYLSPEQCMGRRADARSDIYALGCILYEMICGVTPFSADNAMGLIHLHVTEEPVKPSRRIRRELAAGLDLMVLSCLAKEPDDRYQSMDELNEDLKRVLSGVLPEVAVKRGSASVAHGAFSRKQTATLLIALLLVFALGSAGFAAYYFSDAGLTLRCKQSIQQNSQFENILSWLDKAVEFRNHGKEKQSDEITNAVDDALSYTRLDALKAAKLKLRLAQHKLKQGDSAGARDFAIASLLDFQEARRLRQLGPRESAIVDSAAGRLRKGRGKDANSKLNAELIIALDLQVNGEVDNSIAVVTDAIELLKRKGASRLDAETKTNVLMLIAALDVGPGAGRPYSERAMDLLKCCITGVRLCEASDLPADEASEKFFSRKQSAARCYIGTGNPQGAKAALLQILKETEKEYGENDWARLRLAAVEQQLGNSAPIQKMAEEKLKTMTPAAAAIYIADGEVWAGGNNFALKRLNDSLKFLHRRTSEELDDEIGVYRAMAHASDDCGDVPGKEKNLRRCLELMDITNTIGGKYNATHFQVSRDLIECLKDQRKYAEAKELAAKHSITGTEIFMHH